MSSAAGSRTFELPEGCSSCLGAAEKSYTIVGSYQFDDNGMRHTRTYTLKVPICASCKKASILRSAMGFPALIVIAVSGWLIGSLFRGEWHIWGAIGGTVVGIIVAGLNWAMSAPGEIEPGGLPKFKNPEFQKRFAQLNNIDPNRYGLIDPLDDSTLKYLWEREEENIKAAARVEKEGTTNDD